MPEPLIRFLSTEIVAGLRRWESALDPEPPEPDLDTLVTCFVNRAWPSTGLRAIRHRVRSWARAKAKPPQSRTGGEDGPTERAHYREASDPHGTRWALRCLHTSSEDGKVREWDTEVAVGISEAPAALMTVRLRARRNGAPMPHTPWVPHQLISSVGLIDGAVRMAEACYHVATPGHVSELIGLLRAFRLSPVILFSVDDKGMNPMIPSPQGFYRFNRGVMHVVTIDERCRRLYNRRVSPHARLEHGGILIFDPDQDSLLADFDVLQGHPFSLPDIPEDRTERAILAYRALKDAIFQKSLSAYRFRWALPRQVVDPPGASP